MQHPFEYFQIRPCIEDNTGNVVSFISEADFEEILAETPELTAYWSLYGMGTDGDGGTLAECLGDFTSKEAAFRMLDGVLTILASVRDRLLELPKHDALTRIACDIDDIISQSSNQERL